MFERRSLTGEEDGMMRRRNTTTPKPPMKCVALLQKRRLFGRASTSSRIVAPVVVNPETLSNQAFTTVKGPPQRTYGSIPNMNESTHERTMIVYPSLRVIPEVRRTKMNGKTPTEKVMVKLIRRAERALSFPLATETRMDKSMNSALTKSAYPTFLVMIFRFIRSLLLDCYFSAEGFLRPRASRRPLRRRLS